MEFKTKRKYRSILLFILIGGLPILIFVNIQFVFRLLLVGFMLYIILLQIEDLVVNEEYLAFGSPFWVNSRQKTISWKQLRKIQIVFKDGMTHGAMMPSYIHLIGDGISKKINYQPTKEEYFLLKEIITSKQVEFSSINEPWQFLESGD